MPPNARKATKATARSAPPSDLDGKRDANSGDLDALRVEVAAEPAGSADGPIAVPIAGTTVLVKNFLDWPVSASEALVTGRLTEWARKVLDGDDFATVWAPMDPTHRQVAEFIRAWEKITGVPLLSAPS